MPSSPCHMHTVLHHHQPPKRATRGQGKFKGSGSLADPRVSPMQARPARRGRVREILRVMQFNRQLPRRAPGVAISINQLEIGDWLFAMRTRTLHSPPSLVPAATATWPLRTRRRRRHAYHHMNNNSHCLPTSHSTCVTPRTMPGEPRRGWLSRLPCSSALQSFVDRDLGLSDGDDGSTAVRVESED